jgi:hypothetical protein
MSIICDENIITVVYSKFKLLKLISDDGDSIYHYSSNNDLTKIYNEHKSKNTFKFNLNEHDFYCKWKLGIKYHIHFNENLMDEFKMNNICIKYNYYDNLIKSTDNGYEYEYSNELLSNVMYNNKPFKIINEKLKQLL